VRRWIIVAGVLIAVAAVGGWLYMKQVERERLWQQLSENKFSNVGECLQELVIHQQETARDPARCIEIEQVVDQAVGF
jgi:hypothetical protein